MGMGQGMADLGGVGWGGGGGFQNFLSYNFPWKTRMIMNSDLEEGLPCLSFDTEEVPLMPILKWQEETEDPFSVLLFVNFGMK